MMKTTYKQWCYLALLIFFSSNIIIGQDNIEKIQIDFTMPTGYVRHLLMGFTPDNVASDGYDYGYDALNIDTFADDLNWMIEDRRYIIQGVGAFDAEKKYPLGMFIGNSGDIKIELKGTYQFSDSRNIYIYDSLLETYTDLKKDVYLKTMTNGEYLNRFYIAFKDDSENIAEAKNSLSAPEEFLEKTSIQFLSRTKELLIKTNSIDNTITSINLFNVNGQRLYSSNTFSGDTKELKLSFPQLQNRYGIVQVETNKGIISKQILIQ